MSIYIKIAQFNDKFEGVEKKRENTFTKSLYANLDDVINAAKPVMKECGLVVTQPVIMAEGKQILKTILVDTDSGENIESFIDLDKMTERAGAQGYGSAMTYARRYALCALLGIVESEDDDGNGAQAQKKQDYEYLLEHNKALTECWNVVVEAKFALSRADIDEAKRQMRELSQEQQQALWRAPSKGGVFTTEERQMMQGTRQ
jgi:hypothetical protein